MDNFNTMNNNVPQPQNSSAPPITSSVNLSPQMPLEIRPGGAWSRFWASVIDSLILIFPVVLLAFLVSAIFGSPITFRGDVIKNIENNRIVGIFYLIFYAVYSIYLTVNKGATWGKNAYGLRVVKYRTDENITYPKALLREIIKLGVLLIPIIGGLIYFINGLIIIFSREKRGIHDLVSGTQVLKVSKPWSFLKQLAVFGLIIVAGILVFGLGWFFDKNINPNKPRSETSISVSPSNLIFVEDKIDNWSIQYDSNKFSQPFIPDADFRQKYGKGAFHPNEIRFERHRSISPFCIDSFTIDVQDNPNSLSIQLWQQSQQYYQGTPEQITINGIQGLKVTYTSTASTGDRNDVKTGTARTVSYLIPTVNKVYVLQYNTSDYLNYPTEECQNNERAINQIFETFKPL